MGDLGGQESQGAQAFALAEGLFDRHDAVVEAGFFEGQGRQFGIGRKGADLFVREDMRLARVDVQRADSLFREEERNAQE